MFRYVFLTYICAVSALFSFTDEVSVTEESLPQLPEPMQEEKQNVLIKSLKGMVLVQGDHEVGSFSQVEGIQIDNLNVPGSPQRLKRKLTTFLGKEVTPETLFEIKTTISDFYVSNHHPLVIVEILSQDVTSGVLEVQFLESHFGKAVTSVDGDITITGSAFGDNAPYIVDTNVVEGTGISSVIYNPPQLQGLA